VALIQRNSRRYAKRQLTWFRRDEEVRWFHPSEVEKMIKWIERCVN
ncbi:MAG: tRNA (adenosine(37)-N6)-dimethylallyltransferase MiaA, partial [Alistipes sp.]|nr:tRNA (adenosine(37)-N6)-dimethylallyltransferase MiaA [Alistipes sp.]